jgi:hypothetical protein
MSDKFDELAKALAQPVARRAAVKRFAVGLAAFALGAFGLANNARAGQGGLYARCRTDRDCKKGLVCRYSSLRPGYMCMNG